MKTTIRLLLLSLALPAAALAQGTEAPGTAPAQATADSDTPDAKAAKDLVQKYLVAVKAKKWADAKKFLHPRTVDAIAERKKRLGKEDHPLAPWFHEKIDYYMKDFKIAGAHEAALGTVVVETTEDNFQVQEKGLAEGEKSAYLVGKKDGKWYLVDKKRGETFSNESIKLGYKGWFDKAKKVEDGQED